MSLFQVFAVKLKFLFYSILIEKLSPVLKLYAFVSSFPLVLFDLFN